MKPFLRQFWDTNRRAFLVGTVLVLLLAVWDLWRPFPDGYWFFVGTLCMGVAVGTGTGCFKNEIQREAILFLEYLPISRRQIWCANYLPGFALALLWTLPCLLARAVNQYRHVGSRGPTFEDQGPFAESCAQLFGSATPMGLVVGGIAAVFCAYSLGACLPLVARAGGTAANTVLAMLVASGVCVVGTALSWNFGLDPNIEELAPLCLSTGILVTLAGYVLFVSSPHRLWSQPRALRVLPPLAVAVAVPFLAHLLYLCTRWAEPVLPEALAQGLCVPAVRNGTVLVKFQNRRSGRHLALVDVETGRVQMLLPRLSRLIKSAAHGVRGTGDYADSHGRRESIWVAGTSDISYMDGRGWLGLFAGTPRIVRMGKEGQDRQEIPCAGTNLPARLGWVRYFWAGKTTIIDDLARVYSWHAGGRVLLELRQRDYDAPDRQEPADRQVDSGPRPRQTPMTRILLRDRNGKLLKEFSFPALTASYGKISDSRFYVPVQEDLEDWERRYQDDGAASRPFAHLLLDLESMQEWRPTLPIGFSSYSSGIIAPDLTRAACLRSQKDGLNVSSTLVRVDLQTGTETVVLGPDHFPAYDPRQVLGVSVEWDFQVTQAACLIRRLDGTKVHSSLIHVDLLTAETRELLPEDRLPVGDLTASDAGRGYVDQAGFTPDGTALIYSTRAVGGPMAGPGAAKNCRTVQLDLRTGKETALPVDPLTQACSPRMGHISSDGKKYLCCLEGWKERLIRQGRFEELEWDRRPRDSAPGDQCTKIVIVEFGRPESRIIFTSGATRSVLPRWCRETVVGNDAPQPIWYDTDRILFLYMSKLWIIRADGSGLRQVFPPMNG